MNINIKRAFKHSFLTITLLFFSTFQAQAATNNAQQFDPNEIAVEAYIYLYPLVLMDITRQQMTNVATANPKGIEAPMNVFAHMRTFPPATFKTVVRPNFDTLYSNIYLDLTKEPMILSVPDSDGRYYLLPALDMWTNAFASPGWRTTGTQAGHFAFVPAGWSGTLPEGVTRIDSPTPYVWIIGRTETKGESDYAAVHKFQDGLKVTPLSFWGKEWTAPAGTVDSSVDMKTPPMTQVERMSGKEFFEYAARLLKLHPPHATDFSQIARMEHIGIVPGKDFNFNSLDQSAKQAINNAPKVALKKIRDNLDHVGTKQNGWQVMTSNVGVYGIDYLQRATVAMIGLGANQPADAIYPQAFVDQSGEMLNGKGHYVLHIDKKDLPPADAFWSFTIYDEQGFPIPNEMNRTNLSSWMPLKYNTDGSIDIYFQTKSPGKDKEANWMPTPEGKNWNLTLRIYAPKPNAIDGTWEPVPIKPMPQ